MTPSTAHRALPREGLIRAVFPGVELRAAANGDGDPRMVGHFAVFNQWTRIDSIFEGTFMERFAPGSLRKTMRDNRAGMRVLFQHGQDPQVGDKPLGPIDELREDKTGGWYEVPLLDATYVRDLVLPGLEADLYGASFRFSVIREEIVNDPGVSAHNPDGIQERTVKEAHVSEFGPVTFPAYDGASAGVRSATDEFTFGRLVTGSPERLEQLVAFVERAKLNHQQRGQETPEGDTEPEGDPPPAETSPEGDTAPEVETPPEGTTPEGEITAPSTPDAGDTATSGPERREPTPSSSRSYGLDRDDERPSWAL